ncbi:hypothetical protein ACOME3_009395 [Neoechinorhynchus agilis]
MDSYSPFLQSQDDQTLAHPPPSQISLPPPPSVDPGDYQYLHLPLSTTTNTTTNNNNNTINNNITSHYASATSGTNSGSATSTTQPRHFSLAPFHLPLPSAGGNSDGNPINTRISSDQSTTTSRDSFQSKRRRLPQDSSLGDLTSMQSQSDSDTVSQLPVAILSDATEPLRPNLQNIVSTVNLGCTLDLKKIALQARNAEFNPKRFAAVIMRIRQPRTTALIFSSGKMVCTGAKSEEESRLAARKYARIVQKIGFSARFLDFKIQNMVGSVDVQFPIRLEGLVLQHEQFCSYEPELFPGLIYRMIKPKIVLLIFVSGKVVLTGAKVRREIYDAFDNIYPILRGFRKYN